MKNIAIIVAAGHSSRFHHAVPKQYFIINGKPILRWTIEAFLTSTLIDNILVVINKEHEELYCNLIKNLNILDPIIGGKTRSASVLLGLQALEQYGPRNVLIHDAARPLVSTKIIDKVILQLKNDVAVDLGIGINDTIKYDNSRNIKIIDRKKLYATQTPQGFKYRTILNLHKKNKIPHTDDIGLCIKNNIKVCKVEGDHRNIKITNVFDIKLLQYMMNNEKIYRTGIGIDIHKFSTPLDNKINIKICGINIEHDQSIIAHSDGDVGFHAITEALLGSMALGNIGQLFPEKEKKYKNIDSMFFLECTNQKLRELGAEISNIDVTIICEKPAIMPYSKMMSNNIAKILAINPHQVNIKATTTEKMGFLGNQHGIMAQAICTVICNKYLTLSI